MHILSYKDIEEQRVRDEKAQGVTIRIAVGPEHGAPNFIMRVFTIEPFGHSPLHSHQNEHEIFIYEGIGEIFLEGASVPVSSGYIAFIPPNAEHQIRNTSEKHLVFVCVIPNPK